MVSGYDHYNIMFDPARIGHENTYDSGAKLIVQKYTHDPKTHKMTMVSRHDHYNFMFDTARIGHENTYDTSAKLC